MKIRLSTSDFILKIQLLIIFLKFMLREFIVKKKKFVKSSKH